MAEIDANTTRNADFWDDDTKQIVTIKNLPVRDIIYFRLLERLAAQVSRLVK